LRRELDLEGGWGGVVGGRIGERMVGENEREGKMERGEEDQERAGWLVPLS
jgi:hypothetical protein